MLVYLLQLNLENAMLRLIENPDLRDQLGDNAMLHTRDNYSWERTGNLINSKLLEVR